MKRFVRLPLVLLPLLFLFILLAAARGFSEPGTQGTPVSSFVPGEVLVRMKPGIRIEQVLSGSAVPLSVQEKAGGMEKNTVRLGIKGGETVEEAVETLSRQEGVLFAQPNYVYHTALVPDDSLYPQQWAPAKIGAEAAWNLATGSSDVLVAVLDTGVDLNHPDLAGNLWTNPGETPGDGIDNDGNGYVDDVHGINSTSSPSTPQDVQDTAGHGTHVAGIIGAVGNNGEGIAGLNWNVGIITVKASTGTSFTTLDLAEGIDYVRGLKESKGLDIVAINASLGAAISGDTLLNEAIGDAGEAGILFVAAAGNNGDNNDTMLFYPASLFKPNVLSVAATDDNDVLATFSTSQSSNYGRRTVHLGAPGKNIQSTYRDVLGVSGYASLSGTSMAAPHVTGILALLKAQDATRDWIALKNRLLSGGTPLSSLASGSITGRRLLAAGTGGLGALTGSGQVVQSRLRPIANTLDLDPGTSVDLAALNISDEDSLGNLSVSITRNGSSYGTVTLRDDGAGFDLAPGDGIASATWTVPAESDSTYVFSFPDGNLTITVDLGEEPPAPSGGGGGGGGCSAAGTPGLALLLAVPLVAGLAGRKK